MKSFTTLFLAVAGASVATAQGLSDCATRCTDAVIGQATSQVFNCDANDAKCLCENPNFYYGIRDCSSEACGPDAAAAVASWGEEYCRNAGAALNTGAGGSAPSESDSASDSTSASATTVPSGTISGSPTTIITAISTETITSTISSDGSAVSTVTTESTVFSTDLVSESAIVSTISESTGTFESTVGFTTVTTEAPSETNDGGSAPPTSSSSALGAQVTAAPVVGFIAAAGLAAVLL